MKVQDVMSTDVIRIDAAETTAAAARLLSRHNIGVLPVCKNGSMIGIVTDRDIVLRCIAAGLSPEQTSVSRVMSQRIISVSPEDDVRLASGKMATEQIRRLPVIQNGKLIGMVSIGDIAKQPDYSMEAAECLCDVCDNTSVR